LGSTTSLDDKQGDDRSCARMVRAAGILAEHRPSSPSASEFGSAARAELAQLRFRIARRADDVRHACGPGPVPVPPI
jgi:hypothetical protein